MLRQRTVVGLSKQYGAIDRSFPVRSTKASDMRALVRILAICIALWVAYSMFAGRKGVDAAELSHTSNGPVLRVQILGRPTDPARAGGARGAVVLERRVRASRTPRSL
jgi:hypothetical protein